MKKVVGIMAAALCCAGVVWSNEYQEMEAWLFDSYANGLNENDNTKEYYNSKDAFYAFVGAIKDKIKQEYPVDPQLTKQINDLTASYEAARKAKLLEFGINDETGYMEYYGKVKNNCTSWEEMLKDPLLSQLENLETEFHTSTANVMKAYNDEFQRRYEAAFIEAVKKFQENGTTMK
jgi:hypothetical protein